MTKSLGRKGFVLQDSIQTFDHSSDLYSVRGTARRLPPKEPSVEEILQQRIEHEVKEKLKPEGLARASSVAKFFIQVSKIVLTILIFPPYLFFYLIPKLLIKAVDTTLRFIFKPLVKGYNRIYQKGCSLVSWCKQTFSFLDVFQKFNVFFQPKQRQSKAFVFTRFLKAFRAFSLGSTRKFFQVINQKKISLHLWMKRHHQAIKSHLHKLKQRFFVKMLDLSESFDGYLEKRLFPITSRLTNVFRFFEEKLRRVKSWQKLLQSHVDQLRQSPKKLLSELSKGISHKIYCRVFKWVERAKECVFDFFLIGKDYRSETYEKWARQSELISKEIKKWKIIIISSIEKFRMHFPAVPRLNVQYFKKRILVCAELFWSAIWLRIKLKQPSEGSVKKMEVKKGNKSFFFWHPTISKSLHHVGDKIERLKAVWGEKVLCFRLVCLAWAKALFHSCLHSVHSTTNDFILAFGLLLI